MAKGPGRTRAGTSTVAANALYRVRRSVLTLHEIVSATIRLNRDSGFADFSRRYKVMINGVELGHIKNGGVFECQIPTGKISPR